MDGLMAAHITDIFLNLGELAEILDDVNVLTMPLRYG